jgi:hypothetical protein
MLGSLGNGWIVQTVSLPILEQAVRATVIDEDDQMWDLYQDFRMPFRTGGLLGRALARKEVIGEFGEMHPGQLQTWLTIGYSVRVEKGTLRQPRAHPLRQRSRHGRQNMWRRCWCLVEQWRRPGRGTYRGAPWCATSWWLSRGADVTILLEQAVCQSVGRQ